jgi:formimidoylglutamate deiminase
VLAAPGRSNGRDLFDRAIAGGSAALGASAGIKAGESADFVSFDSTSPTPAGKAGDAILDAWIFASGACIDGVWVNGRQQVIAGRHCRREEMAERFRRTMLALSDH